MPTSEVLTALEVANLLRIDRVTVYKMVKRGELPALKVGSDWRFSRVQIEEWMRSRTQGPGG
jgi:excisionase family DNA binding protein